MSGQINLDSSLGRLLANLAKTHNSIVEIGTWNGQGSTQCILSTLLTRLDQSWHFTSLECNETMFQQAMQCWNNKITVEQQQQVEFLLGTILNLKDLPSLDILEKQHGFVQEWYEQDITWLKQTVNHLDKLPATIDLLILDGGEYTTYSEWQLLKSRVTTVVLDDTKTCKCRDIYQELHQDQDWLVVADHPNDRNGWAVFRHK